MNPHYQPCPVCHKPIGERYRVAALRDDGAGQVCVYVHPDCLEQAHTLAAPGVRVITTLAQQRANGASNV